LSAEQLLDAFRHVSNNTVIWKSLKNLIESYFFWLKEQNVDVSKGMYSLAHMNEKELRQNITKQFFYSTNQILAKLKMDVLCVSQLDQRDAEDYCMIECAVLLSWFGLQPREMAEFKKYDISTKNGMIKIRGIWTIVPEAAINKLYDCAIATAYSKINGTTIFWQKYMDSEYLFRTSISDRMSVATINSMLPKFNQKIDPESIPYIFGRIYWSGVYFRTRLEEKRIGGVPEFKSNKEKMEFYSRLFHEEIKDVTTFINRVEEYNLYKSVF
jgi:hypothetical protein